MGAGAGEMADRGAPGRHRDGHIADSPADAEAFAKEVGVTYPIVLDVPGKVGDQYHAVALPVQYWVNRDGSVRDWAFGELPPDPYDPALAKILPGSSAAP
jgi:hypothetical protein